MDSHQKMEIPTELLQLSLLASGINSSMRSHSKDKGATNNADCRVVVSDRCISAKRQARCSQLPSNKHPAASAEAQLVIGSGSASLLLTWFNQLQNLEVD
jgi:hypothetical protein